MTDAIRRRTYEPRHRAVWITVIHPACTCSWDRDENDTVGYWMVRRDPRCVVHVERS